MIYALVLLVHINGATLWHPFFSYYPSMSECEAQRAKVMAVHDEHVSFTTGCFDVPTYMANYDKDEPE